MSVQTSLTDDLTAAAWRYAIAAFFLQSIHDSWPVSENFAEAGKPEAWGPAYQAAHADSSVGTTYEEVELPSKIEGEPYTIPTPTKDGDTFIGWYDNAQGTGTALTVLPVGYDGTVYAIWQSGIATDAEHVQVEAVKVQKILRNGQILIMRDGKVYNMMGQIVEN